MTGIDESLRFAFDKACASTPRANASLRSDHKCPLGIYAVSRVRFHEPIYERNVIRAKTY